MNTGGEAAEQIVRMSLETGEVALKITGQGAKQLAVLLYAILKDQKKTKGRIRLESMCRNTRDVKVFSVSREDVKTFVRKAKDYGMLYCAVRGRKDGMVDFLVRAEDAPKANRIVERFRLASVEEKKDVAVRAEQAHIPNPARARAGKSHPSEPISGTQGEGHKNISEEKERGRPSVRRQLREMEAARGAGEKSENARKKDRGNPGIQYKQPRRGKSQKVR